MVSVGVEVDAAGSARVARRAGAHTCDTLLAGAAGELPTATLVGESVAVVVDSIAGLGGRDAAIRNGVRAGVGDAGVGGAGVGGAGVGDAGVSDARIGAAIASGSGIADGAVVAAAGEDE